MNESGRTGRIEIVGAGPSGLAAALAARALNAEIVVYEKRHDVGARFHGDFQGLENWTRRKDVLAELEQQGIDPSFDHVPVYEIVYFDPAGAILGAAASRGPWTTRSSTKHSKPTSRSGSTTATGI